MNYKELLDCALKNLMEPNCVSRIAPTQSIQAKHFQTFKMTPNQYKTFKSSGHSNTVYALDFLVKYKPENIHDNGHYICVMYQGEKIFEKKRKGFWDFGFRKVLKDFERTYDLINDFHAEQKREQLLPLIRG